MIFKTQPFHLYHYITRIVPPVIAFITYFIQSHQFCNPFSYCDEISLTHKQTKFKSIT